MKKTILLTASILLYFVSFANPINKKLAETVAKNFIFEKTGIAQKTVIFNEVITKSKSNLNLFYVFTYKNGFVIVAADNNVVPILGYSTKNKYYKNNVPPQMIFLLNTYAEQIKLSIDKKIKASSKTKKEWSRYLKKTEEFVSKKNKKAVSPLLGSIYWGQGEGWNAYCPEDAGGDDGHTYVGCVATAIGQIMKYYEYPANGVGSYSYTHDDYGNQSANFESTTYDWQSMSNNVGTNASALLLYHIGVSVDMDYGPSGSGASSVNAPYILANYFKYFSSATFIRKENYTDANWKSIIKNEIDYQRPVFYSGTPSSGGGHAFVLDGYDDSDQFHINWGWEASHNGYFLLSDLTPSTYDYTYNQVAAIGIMPDFSEPYEISANFYNNDATILWKQPLCWNSYARMNKATHLHTTNSEKATLIDNADFGFNYPATIQAVSHAFYENDTWDDASFKFKIYNTDGSELLYESPNIEARHREEVFHTLTTPLEVNGDFYIAIDNVGSSGYPSSRSKQVAVGETNSYRGSAGAWSIFEGGGYGYELITGVYIAGSGYLSGSSSKIVDGYELYRDNNLILTASSSTFNYTDANVSNGSYKYCVKAVYNNETSVCTESETVTTSNTQLNNDKINIKIYPNPAKDIILINNCKIGDYLEIFDAVGKKVLTKNINKNESKININKFKPGIYFLKINSNKGQETFKIIKK